MKIKRGDPLRYLINKMLWLCFVGLVTRLCLHVPDDIFCWGDWMFFLAMVDGHENLETEVSTHLRFT